MLLSLTGISDYSMKRYWSNLNTKSNRLLSASTRWEETYIMLHSKIPSPCWSQGDVGMSTNDPINMKKNSIVETADTVYIILRHTQMAISTHRIPKTSQKKQQGTRPFFRCLCIPCSKIFRLQYRHTFGVGLERTVEGWNIWEAPRHRRIVPAPN